MNSGFSKVARTVPLPTDSPGNKEVLFTTPPIVSETVAMRCGGMTIVPLKETWLGLEVAEVTASTCTVSGTVSSTVTTVATVSSVCRDSLFELHAASKNSTTENVIFFIVISYLNSSYSKAAMLY